MKINLFIFTYTIIALFLVVFLLMILINAQKIRTELKNENELYKTILKADFELYKISLDSQKAESYYDEASYFYENQEYILVESNCRLARDYYSKESQEYKNVKAELLASEIKDKLIDIYIDSLNSLIKISDSMYEACEHFESASRYYDKYYAELNYKDSDYDMGTAEIDNMNEKIIAHDIAVGEYNQYLEDFRVELEKRLK
jgi:hypothetical protein